MNAYICTYRVACNKCPPNTGLILLLPLLLLICWSGEWPLASLKEDVVGNSEWWHLFSTTHFSGLPSITRTIHGNPPTISGFLVVIICLTRVLGSGSSKMNKTVPVFSEQQQPAKQILKKKKSVRWMLDMWMGHGWEKQGVRFYMAGWKGSKNIEELGLKIWVMKRVVFNTICYS